MGKPRGKTLIAPALFLGLAGASLATAADSPGGHLLHTGQRLDFGARQPLD